MESPTHGLIKRTYQQSGKKRKTIYEFSGVVDKIEYRNAAGTLTGTDDFTYNDLLRRTAATSRYGINNAWTYDDQGRMLTESTTYSGQTYNVGFRYDSRGRLDEITYPSSRKAAYTFDERSSIDLIQWDGSTIEDRGYDDLARLNATTRTGSAVDETRTYDNAGRLTGITNTNVGDASYTYDANHNKLSESWTGAMAAWNFVTTNAGANPQGYDAEDRFRNFVQAGQSKSLYLDRSDIGNITNYQMNGANQARTYNNIHALTNIGGTAQTFDTDGNLATSQFGHTNSWDEAGMMKQSVVPTGSAAGIEGTNEYGYDATQRRIFKKITRNSSVAEHTVSIHAGPNLIAEYPAGTAAATPSNEFVYAQEIDSLVMLVRSTGGGSGNEKLTITRNQQWSVTALSDASSGNVVERYTYDAFGKRTILEPNGTTVRATSSYNMPFGYTSRQHDAETGLMYFRARYFDTASGEFTSTDPMEYVDGKSLYRGYFLGQGVDPLGLLVKVQDDQKQGTPHDDQLNIVEELKKLCDDCPDENCIFTRDLHPCTKQACQKEAELVGRALENTYRCNGTGKCRRFLNAWGNFGSWCTGGLVPPPDDDRVKGYFCYEWAHSFHQAALIHLKNSKCFALAVEQAEIKGSDEIHAWLKITSECSGKSIFYDDGFMGGFEGRCHQTMPCAGEYTFEGTCTEPYIPANCPHPYDGCPPKINLNPNLGGK